MFSTCHLLSLCCSSRSCPEGTVLPLCPAVTRGCDLWTSLVASLGHLVSSLFCLVVPCGEAVPHLWSSWWPLPEPSLVQTDPLLRSEEQNCTGNSRCRHMRNTCCGTIVTFSGPFFKNHMDFPYFLIPNLYLHQNTRIKGCALEGSLSRRPSFYSCLESWTAPAQLNSSNTETKTKFSSRKTEQDDFKAIHPNYRFIVLFENILCESFLCFSLFFKEIIYCHSGLFRPRTIQTLQKALN